ncbi:MAG: coenzyme F390 synthetase [Planctomycetaceae bacterium]|nr:MAG: coenzyme F390 synthetase [Planctomycetaceae bacterium]
MSPQPERWSADELRSHQLQRLQHLLKVVWRTNLFWRRKLATSNVDPRAIASLEDWQHLPLCTKQEFVDDQQAHPPFGTNLSYPLHSYVRLHQTSGTTTGYPLRWLDTPDSWKWMLSCWRTHFRLMELRPDDRLAFLFSFGPFLGFWASFEGAQQAGLFCVATGGMSSERRLALIRELKITVIGCTPTYALRLSETAAQLGIEPASLGVNTILVAGEPGGLVEGTRRRLEESWGARVIDHWGMTEVGPLATEYSVSRGSLTLLESECYPEIIDPHTGALVPPGTVGELVITNFGRVGSPVIRYRTGDLVCADTHAIEQAPPWLRLKGGILGRTDDMLIIRGNNVFPSSIESVLRNFASVGEYQIRVLRERGMPELQIVYETLPPLSDSDRTRLQTQIRQAIELKLGFRVGVEEVPLGTLPRSEMKSRRIVFLS